MFSTTKKLTTGILFVLTIVFIGVFGAFCVQAKKSNNSDQDIRIKLKETKIDYIHFKNMKISDAVKMISEKYKIKITLLKTPEEKEKEAVVDLTLKKKNLYQLIYFFCKDANLKFRIRGNAVIMSYKLIPPTKEEIQREKELAKARAINDEKWKLLTKKKLKKIIFPSIEFKDASIFTVIRVLNRYGKRNDPDKVGISVIAGFTRKTADELPKITMSLKNTPMNEILRKLCKNTGLKYKIEEGAVIILADSTKKYFQKKLKPENLAINAAKNWLALVDVEKYPESWEQASQLFKGAVSKGQWEKAIKRARKPFGKNIFRKLKLKRFHASLPGAPDGNYFVIQFNASFKNKKSAIETITLMLDKDRKWRVSGYFIK